MRKNVAMHCLSQIVPDIPKNSKVKNQRSWRSDERKIFFFVYEGQTVVVIALLYLDDVPNAVAIACEIPYINL